MAAYADLISLMYIIEQIQQHPRPPISLQKEQVESLTGNITLLQHFLEEYSHIEIKEIGGLESRIADAAHVAEDVIESHIVDVIESHIVDARSTSSDEEEVSPDEEEVSPNKEISSVDFYQSLQKVIEEMDSIKEEAMEIKKKTRVQDQLHKIPTPAASLRSSSSTGQNTMVGFDDVMLEVIDKLTGQQSDRQIIPIVGMGGMGKTTLAKNIYMDPLIVQHFDICAWATISQLYNVTEILREVLRQVNKEEGGDTSELGEILYKYLCGRRYLIVMDDMWSIDVWDKIKFFFPEYNNGSRMVVTTRLSSLVFQLTGSYGFAMKFLDENKSWDLFCKTVFGEDACPLELEEVGKKITKNCKGLPLSIVVIGGLLEKSKHIPDYWEFIAENLNSMVNSEDNERCLKILQTSYKQLPVYLKPCFLYMGVFLEDSWIYVSELIGLWVAEGFLKPINGKSLEEVGRGYLKDLIDRNLILVDELGSIGNVKRCNIHDLLRDLCLREAQKEKFLYVTSQHNLDIPRGTRRIAYHQRIPKEGVTDFLQSTSLARSLICDSESNGAPSPINFRLLRVFRQFREQYEDIFRLVNSRFIRIGGLDSVFHSSISLLWNLHTLIVTDNSCKDDNLIAPPEIWKMPQLRHVWCERLRLPDPPSDQLDMGDDFVLQNLHTLAYVRNFKCSKEVVRRISNIGKLGIRYDDFDGSSTYSLYNLHHLNKLESFYCSSFHIGLLQNLTFPHSLKKLTLENGHWDDVLEKIGSLPLLEKLKLKNGKFKRNEWVTVEGQFCSLKFLQINDCYLQYWSTDNTHFPRLEHLVLNWLEKLEKIPSCIGDIPTLQSIEIEYCSDSSIISAKNILEEQEELWNHGLHIKIVPGWSNDRALLKSLARPNFQVSGNCD